MKSVYIETTVISYLTARPSSQLVLAAHQAVTRDWWDNERRKYRCVVSEEVIQEAGRGDPQAALRRLAVLNSLESLPLSEEARALARNLVGRGPFPPSMYSDAVHISVAICNGIDYLATWNCRHLSNPAFLERLHASIAGTGWKLPLVCTPFQLIGGSPYVHE